MRDRPPILAGLVLFLAVASFPVWYNAATGAAARAPEVARAAGAACVEPPAYMRAAHMDLLLGWREQVVREGRRSYVAGDGRGHAVSLAGTCMRCHGAVADFCDRCHTYAGVRVPCWGCHVDPGPRRTGA
ncbi:MAG: sulfate reduction electron transfer complex DsrMKJOP subunit DsrJ [Candidatus Methylomirabilales bacterium]